MAKEKKEIEKLEIVDNPERNIMSDKTRHIIVAIVAAVIVIGIVLVAILGNGNDPKKNSDSNSNKESNITSNTSNISSNTTSNTEKKERDKSTKFLKEFYEAFDSKDIKVIFFARTSCGYCQLQKPILKNVAKDYDLDYFNIDTDELSETEVSEVMSALGIGGSTPNTVVVKEGKVLATSNGYLDGKAYVKYLVKNGVLKEGSVYKQEKNLKEIDYSDFKKIAKEDKASLVFLDTSACQACTTVRSLLNEFADDNDFEVYYLNSYNLTEDDVTDLVDKRLDEMGYDEEQYKEDKSVSVPLLLVVKDNKIKDYILKSTDESDYKKLLKKYDFIK